MHNELRPRSSAAAAAVAAAVVAAAAAVMNRTATRHRDYFSLDLHAVALLLSSDNDCYY